MENTAWRRVAAAWICVADDGKTRIGVEGWIWLVLRSALGQYCGNRISVYNPLISPGKCVDISWWRNSIPTAGIFITYGAEEVFTPEIRKLVTLLESAGISVRKQEEKGGIHAWPVASLFLGSTRATRLKGLEQIVLQIGNAMNTTHEWTTK